MGYTHQWYFDDSAADWQAGFSDLVADADRIVAASPVPLEVTINDDKIAVNGVGGQGVETLLLFRRHPRPFIPPAFPNANGLTEPALPFAFVKTENRGYDVAVTAILLRALVRLGSAIEVHSDGQWSAWGAGVALVASVFGPDGVPDRPATIEEN